MDSQNTLPPHAWSFKTVMPEDIPASLTWHFTCVLRSSGRHSLRRRLNAKMENFCRLGLSLLAWTDSGFSVWEWDRHAFVGLSQKEEAAYRKEKFHKEWIEKVPSPGIAWPLGVKPASPAPLEGETETAWMLKTETVRGNCDSYQLSILD
jgi:hypothetical protein